MEYVSWTNETSKNGVFKNWFTQIWPKTNSLGIIVSEGLMRLYNDSPSFRSPRSIHQGGSNRGGVTWITWRPLPLLRLFGSAKLLCGWWILRLLRCAMLIFSGTLMGVVWNDTFEVGGCNAVWQVWSVAATAEGQKKDHSIHCEHCLLHRPNDQNKAWFSKGNSWYLINESRMNRFK